MHRITNLLIGYFATLAGMIMALGVWVSMNDWPGLNTIIERSIGGLVIMTVVAMTQSQKEIKKVSQFGIAIGFLWMLTAMLLNLEL